MNKLLTRDEFRESVFKRDGNLCVICKNGGKLDAHHIIERRLFNDGGYYLDNGASLCSECHIKAEQTLISCKQLREKIGAKIIVPDSMYPDLIYTKWGDEILSNGMRMQGPLFNDENVQKILKSGGVLSLYTEYVKYPRTLHLPWSEGQTKDDRTLSNCDIFKDKEVVVTIKMDGENSTVYKDYCHARSLDSKDHWSRSWIKNLQAKIGHELPDKWRLCGENLFAKHSIKYDNLKDYFYLFSIWNEKNVCLSWDETKQYAEILGLTMVEEIYRGIFDENVIRKLYSSFDRNKVEGYVVRNVSEYHYKDFQKNVAKFVRKEHVGTSHHWFHTSTEKNLIKK